MLYRGDGGAKFWNGDIWKAAFTDDDEQFQKRVENYYKEQNVPERANMTKAFYRDEYYWLEKEAEKNAKKWNVTTDEALITMANDNTYDYYGYWLSNASQSNNGHYPDTYKTVYHPTFSKDSKYSKGHPDFQPDTEQNPFNIEGGSWEELPNSEYSFIKGFYKPSTDQLGVFPNMQQGTSLYLRQNDP